MDEIEARSNGRVEFERIFGGALGSLEEQPLNLRGRVFDLGAVSAVYSPGLLPVTEAAVLPFLVADWTIMSRVHYDFMNTSWIEAEFAALNAKGLVPYSLEPMEIMSHVAASTIEELKPLKIRAHGGAADALTAAGLIAVAVPWPELPVAAERHVVDAAIIPTPASALDFGFGDIFKYALRVPFYFFHYTLAINLDAWNELPADIQQIMLDTAAEAQAKNVELVTVAIDDAWAAFAELGVEQVPWSKAELATLQELGGVPVWDQWVEDREAEGIPGREILDHLLALIAEY